MSWLDISTYIIQNIGVVIGVAVIAMGVFFMGFCFFVSGEASEKAAKIVGLTLIGAWIFVVLSAGVICLLPTHDRILRVKIARIKDEAVTDQNLRQGVDVIQRIGHKLECKYLGCEKSKDK